ncbi:1,4-dihydroxy-2-naphthoate octaprenyltransferase [Blattabacterium sp. (Blattella germanica) str. Bge]|uniref:1,4-dihydroxy-2-naphthoate octaprenyltransferase n=1 Tax=Blattabacterium sp. (Blattella germanica) TaxID=624186 RepID=UPI0001BB6157|nr:1,4-dihydroxy-2-naphthoate octaprenyltransferase [Blattabacterium sp. (Blattella germanica)]ACY40289.1 1,4-dihydroxy-2-naphthoate octaprenyltransferase [Blattabacterium sp. (Blattella germanica) str. Bge]
MKLKYWIDAARFHTLPLSFSGVTLSFLISQSRVNVNLTTYILCVLTALLLQILANFSNDYGDSITGVDNFKRIGPKRTVQCGFISLYEMKIAIYLFSVLSFLSGLLLLYQSILYTNVFIFLFYIIGIFVCIYSSIKYSIGSYPYGYIVGIGDLFVFIFFGILSVQGSYFLYTQTLHMDMFLLSLSMGLLNVAVLNINNMRDMDNDYENGKHTIAGWLGIKYAKLYHITSIFVSVILGGFFIFLNQKTIYQWIFFILVVIFLIFHVKRIIFLKKNKLFNLELKKLILIVFLYVLSIGISNLL